MLRPHRIAPLALALAAATLGVSARAEAQGAPPSPPTAAPAPSGPALTPGAQALLAAEEPTLGSTALDLGEAVGGDLWTRTIRRVDVVTVGGRWAAPFSITDAEAQPGKPASPETARRIMRAALSSGRFARANVEAFPEDGGVVLRLNVLPRRLIASVRLTGGALETAETLEAADVTTGGELTFPRIAQIEARVRELYEKRGFPAAVVRVDAADTDQADKVVLSIDVKPGTPRTVSWRGFVVDPVVDPATGVTRATPASEREVGGLTSDYKVSTGARVDDAALADADRDLGLSLKQHGFFRAEVRHKLTTSGPHTYLFVYVYPGPRYVPAFEGNKAFDAVDLEDALKLEKAPEARLDELQERLRAFYVARGFLDAEVSVAERYPPGDPVHTLAFTLREHRQVRVKRRVYPCLAGELSPDDIGREIDSYLEEELPGSESFGPVDPRVAAQLFGPTGRIGGRGQPADLVPAMTYAPETYDRAVKHVRDLLHSKGYLNAVVGPVSLVRPQCSKRSPAGACVPVSPKVPLMARCLTDALGLPVPEPPVPAEHTCRPDPAKSVECGAEMTVRIPVAPGPRTTLYDLVFEGNHALDSKKLAEIATHPGDAHGRPEDINGLHLGDPLSNVEVEAARVRVQDAYRVEGFAYADVRAEQEPSPDRTRARVRFSISERERVTVSGFVVRGASRTSEALILGRLSLKKDKEYRQDDKRLSEDAVRSLGTFSSVSIALEDAENPHKEKRAVVTVAELPSQYLEQRPGFSTGDGVRYTFEYGHRNLGGLAISAVLRLQLSYLPDALILDPAVLKNYSTLSVVQRLERRDTISVTFHEIGLGPRYSLLVEAVDLNDNQRDYGLEKEAIVPTITFHPIDSDRPVKPLTVQLGVSTELNNVSIFGDVSSGLATGLVRAPAGRTVAFAERAVFTADNRDNPFNATRGVIFSTSAEHVDAIPADASATIQSHFIRFSGRVAGYYTVKGITVVGSLAAGGNLQLSSGSLTYPDRLFFLGGVDTNRAFLADSMVPQDIVDQFRQVRSPCPPTFPEGWCPRRPSVAGQPFTGLPLGQRSATITDVELRGGDLSINPRVEVRLPLPIFKPLQAGIFLDMGNLWVDPSKIRFDENFMRFGLGAGLRYPTPIGPVAIDYGFNLNQRPWEDVGAFHFSIGLF